MAKDPSFVDQNGGDPGVAFEALINRFTHPSKASIHTAALVIREEIRNETRAGLSFDGTPFASYSKSYEREKGQTNVDLYSKYAQPHMLDALDVKITSSPPLIEIGIFGDDVLAARARLNNEGGSGRTGRGRLTRKKTRVSKFKVSLTSGTPARPWLGTNDRTIDRATQSITEDLVKGP